MITIPEVVEQIIRQTPFLEEGLTQGIINYSALARLIKPHIEEQLVKDVQTGAIMMALRRMAKKKLRKSDIKKLFEKNVEMIVRSNLVEYTFSNSQVLVHKIEELLGQIKNQNRYFFTITQGVFETDVIVSDEIVSKIQKIFGGENLINKLNNLSCITIRLPEENVVIPGVYYFILKALVWEGINITEIVSTYREFSIILTDSEVDKAFSILKKNLSYK